MAKTYIYTCEYKICPLNQTKKYTIVSLGKGADNDNVQAVAQNKTIIRTNTGRFYPIYIIRWSPVNLSPNGATVENQN